MSSHVVLVLTLLRVFITVLERAFSGSTDAGEKVLSLLPEGELKITTIRRFTEAQASAKFAPPGD